MLIKKMKSLYTNLIIKMIISLAVGILIFMITLVLGTLFSSQIESQRQNRINLLIQETAEEIQGQITLEKMTFQDVENYKWKKGSFEIYFDYKTSQDKLLSYFIDDTVSLLSQGITRNGITYVQSNSYYLFDIKTLDYMAVVLIYSSHDGNLSFMYYVLAAVIGIISFFTTSIYLLKPTFDYISAIESGVKMIASKDLTYKIPLIGDNELTSLASEINYMGQQINEKIIKEKELDRSQRMLITNISHDLRTPLTSILGYIDLLDVTDHVRVVKRNALRLEKLIKDLFFYSKITSNDLIFDYVNVDLNRLVHQVVEIRRDQYKFFPCDEKLMVYVDLDKLQRILDNLFNNAEIHGTLDDIIIVTYRDKTVSYLEIRNQTCEDLTHTIDKLGNRLYTADESRSSGSSGLGLSIVKDLTEKMNGHVSFEYGEGQFKVILSFS